MTEPTTPFDVDALLNGTVNDLADLPEFKPFPSGAHAINVKLEVDKTTKSVYYMRMQMRKTLELNNASDPLPAEGDETSIRFDLQNEFGQGNFKKVMLAAAAKFGDRTNMQLIAELADWQPCKVVTGVKEDKKKDVVYTILVEILFE